MKAQDVHTETLVELYSMSKQYAENNRLTDRQEHALKEAEAIIQNLSGWEITDPLYD